MVNRQPTSALNVIPPPVITFVARNHDFEGEIVEVIAWPQFILDLLHADSIVIEWGKTFIFGSTLAPVGEVLPADVNHDILQWYM